MMYEEWFTCRIPWRYSFLLSGRGSNTAFLPGSQVGKRSPPLPMGQRN
jgi:hypothetical protein